MNRLSNVLPLNAIKRAIPIAVPVISLYKLPKLPMNIGKTPASPIPKRNNATDATKNEVE